LDERKTEKGFVESGVPTRSKPKSEEVGREQKTAQTQSKKKTSEEKVKSLLYAV
jgi:hypothetical protein